MDNQPILSFCIPTFNRAKRVFNCVKHILSYEGNEIEVIVSDNASTDNTVALLSEIVDSRLTVYTNDFNLGSLNWPLVVARAKGKWAALMSDEDIVLVENLPFYFSQLNEFEKKGIGGIIFSFPPIYDIWQKYVCNTLLESLLFTLYMGGHITGHIIYREYLDLEPHCKSEDLVSYMGFGISTDSTNEYYAKFGEKTESPIYVSNPPVAEPQHEMILRIAKEHCIALMDTSLCVFGKDETVSKKPEKLIPEIMGGKSIVRRLIIVKSAMFKIFEVLKNPDLNCSDEQKEMALLNVLRSALTTTARYVNDVISGTDRYRPEQLRMANDYFHYTRKDVTRLIIETAEDFYNIMKQNVDKKLLINIDLAITYLRQVLNNDFSAKVSDNISTLARMQIGNLLFQIYNRAHEIITITRDSEGYIEKEQVTYTEEIHAVLGLKETDSLYVQLRRKKDYFAVVEESCDNFRAMYLRGEAFFKLREWEKAKECIHLFLNIVKNSQNIADIMTGIPSICNSYFFLAYIEQKLGQMDLSIKYFSDYYKLSDSLLMKQSALSLFWTLPRKRVLLLGVTGFVGSNLIQRLHKKFDIVCPNREELNLLDSIEVQKYLKHMKFDAVINCAIPTSQNPLDPIDELFERSLKIFNTIASCSEHYKKMIYIGSGAEYGKHRNISEISEQEFGNEIPQDQYGLSRYIINEIGEGKSNIINLRLFGCCGKNDPPYKLIPYIANCINENKKIILRENKRFDYLFVGDIAAVLEYFIENDAKYKSYNLCSGKPIMISEIADEVKRYMKCDLPVIFENKELGCEYTGSNLRLQAEIQNWNPIPIKQAIKTILYEENYI